MPDVTASTPRLELPVDPWVLAPLGEAFEAALADGLQQLGLLAEPAGSPRARRSYEAHARLLREWNAAINLTAIRDPAEVARRHVCDSLSVVPRLTERLAPGAALLDIGSGGGYPGLPLAAALPLGRTGLLESVGKKARFLAVAAAAVRSALADDDDGLSSPAAMTAAADIGAIAERAEDLAQQPEHRGAWDVVTARAVGSLAEVIELAMPLLHEGGLAVAWKREEERDGLLAELRDAGSIIRATGGGRPEVVSAGAGSLPGHRLIIVTKERRTPASYPRPAAVRRGRHR